MRRFLILLPLIIVPVVILFACNNNGITTPGPTIAHFVSVQVCKTCHITKNAEWSQTRHARALIDLNAAGPQPSCIKCHVVGLDNNPANSGYDDPDPAVAARFGGVQCEACHGMASEHINTFGPPPSPLGPEVCGGCHDGVHHPTYTEWGQSLHAAALDARDKSSHFSTECLQCHSADYIFADSVPEDATPQDFQYGITCVVCHDPHSDENPFQLRADIVTLCAGCHNDEGATPGSSPHHPNANMFQGVGGAEYPGKTYDSSFHTYLEDGCAACHMWTAPFDETTNTAISGHTFKPVIQACQECHPGLTTFDRNGAQTHVHELLDELKAKLDAATDTDKLTLSYAYANFNYNFCTEEGSFGIHNYRYAVALLSDSIADFNPGS